MCLHWPLPVLQEYIMNKLQKQLEKLGGEKGSLQRERSELQKQVGELAGAVDKLNKDKVRACAGWPSCRSQPLLLAVAAN